MIDPKLIPLVCGIALIPLIILAIYGDKALIKIRDKMYSVVLKKSSYISKLNESQQELHQAKGNLVYIISKILPLTDSSKELLIGENLAEHRVHLTLTCNNALGFHIEIESIEPKVLIDGWELGGRYETSMSWLNVNSCRIEIDQSITPDVASELRQKREDEITIGCDLILAIWIRDANIRSQARYSFAV